MYKDAKRTASTNTNSHWSMVSSHCVIKNHRVFESKAQSGYGY
jgi:hypothetical protein